jgi:arsenite/tail-anchored protein-transporting ATPase
LELNIEPEQEFIKLRIILYTGKGGVGKTSIASATAVKSARLGHKTMVMSTDPAHSLADALDVRLNGAPQPVAENLWAQEIDIYRELDTYWKTVQDWIVGLMRWQGADDILAEELAVLPGMEELAALLHITSYQQEGFYDTLIVDCAPTGETLRLLSFPDMARWYMNRLFPLERKVAAAVGPLARGMLKLPVPGPAVFESIQKLYYQLDQMRTLLLDPKTSSIRLVVNPEKMVIKEAQRTFTYLNLYGYHTDLIVCNRILPDNIDDPFFRRWQEIHQQYIKQIEETFAPVPIFRAPLMDHEIVGVEELGKLGDIVFEDKDPTTIFYAGKVDEIEKVGDGYQLRVKLPFASDEELSVMEAGNELIVHVGRYRRNITLPMMLAAISVNEARLDKDVLTLSFKKV